MSVLQNFTHWLNERPWLNAVFLILAVASFVSAIAFYFKSRRERRPVFRLRSFPLIEGRVTQVPALRITFADRPIDDLVLTRVALWNRGSEPIEPANMAATEPFRLVINSPAILLGARIVHAANPANGFSVDSDFSANVVTIGFEYFQRDEGIVVEVYHTGASQTSVSLHGTVKGARPLQHFTADHYTRSITRPLNEVMERWTPKRKGPQTAFVMIALPFIVVFMLVLVPFALVDYLSTTFQRPPRMFLLEGRRPPAA